MANDGTLFQCANCDALYQVVRAEVGPETVDREIICRACAAPMPSREGKFVFKYFLVRRGRMQQRRRA